MRVKGRGASRTHKYTLVQMALLYFRIHSFRLQFRHRPLAAHARHWLTLLSEPTRFPIYVPNYDTTHGTILKGYLLKYKKVLAK
jgi:hypothetical protein